MRDHYLIAEVLTILKSDHPNLNVAKVRLLEHEGAIQPVRGTDGHRYYSAEDISAALPSADW